MPKDKKTSRSTQESVNISFDFSNETKGALRFQEVDGKGEQLKGDDSVVGTLYFRKAALAKLGFKEVPEGCTVTVLFR